MKWRVRGNAGFRRRFRLRRVKNGAGMGFGFNFKRELCNLERYVLL